MEILSKRRLAIITIAAIICTIVFALISTIKVHSESDVEYRQTKFVDTGGEAINPQPMGIDSQESVPLVIEMSFEVDKVTPTPTPVIHIASDDVWTKLADCESHQNWRSDTGNGYFGGLQFSMGAWASVGGSGKPSDASSDEQIMRGKLLQQKRGWGPWGTCSKRLGLM